MKKFIVILYVLFLLTGKVFSAGSTGGDTKSNYDQAVKLIKSAKKSEEKGKKDKAQSKYERAFKFLIKSNQKKPNKADTLNYLGFTSRKLGDFTNAERYYQMGLDIDPKHVGINEYMGELYLSTNRPELAKERLAVLKDCNCEEYDELKALIEGKKESKY